MRSIKNVSVGLFLVGLVLLAFMIFRVIGIYYDVRDYKLYHNITIDLVKGLKAIYYSNSYIELTLLLTAIIGYFLRNRIGWMLTCVLFYFYAFNFIFILFPGANPKWFEYSIILIPFSSIGLMNLRQVLQRFKLQKHLIIYNQISIVIALYLIYLQGYLNLYCEHSIWEIIDYIK